MLLLAVIACSGSLDPTPKPARQAGNGNQAEEPEAAEFPDKDLIVTATCARVTVTGWDVRTWKTAALRTFDIPAEVAVNREDSDARSPLIELCGNAFRGLGGPDDGPREAPEDSRRRLFDKDDTRMAFLLLNPETGGTLAGCLDAEGKVTALSRQDSDAFTDAPRERNAVSFEDGDAVWFTQDIDEATVRIVSRSASEEHALWNTAAARACTTMTPSRSSATRRAASTARPSGQPRRAESNHADQRLRLEHRQTAAGKHGDQPDSDLFPIPYESECEPRGWLDDVTVLCGHVRAEYDVERTNSFSRLDTSLLDRDESIRKGLLSGPIIPSTDRGTRCAPFPPTGNR
ncbi:hypothetical protein [Streptomyces sp. B22F1]|uniref:hypothetical protein n=1 Tax=Streptomyces sp. B22F1 TaxID=3153566 RepID=UPI00325EED9B